MSKARIHARGLGDGGVIDQLTCFNFMVIKLALESQSEPLGSCKKDKQGESRVWRMVFVGHPAKQNNCTSSGQRCEQPSPARSDPTFDGGYMHVSSHIWNHDFRNRPFGSPFMAPTLITAVDQRHYLGRTCMVAKAINTLTTRSGYSKRRRKMQQCFYDTCRRREYNTTQTHSVSFKTSQFQQFLAQLGQFSWLIPVSGISCTILQEGLIVPDHNVVVRPMSSSSPLREDLAFGC